MEHSTTAADTQYGFAGADVPSQAVVRTVADAKGVDATELAPLYDVVDPDRLDALFASRGGPSGATTATGEVRFSYEGYEVRVTAAGRVHLTDD